ncbi:MAG: tetratricopeptide repeat protein [Kofleriaceae bacterium]
MRLLRFLVAVSLVACGGRATTSTLPAPAQSVPAADLAEARSGAVRVEGDGGRLAAKDPRVTDLDIIRIRAGGQAPGGEPELTSVASADLFRAATELAQAGTTQAAIAQYRQLIADFPESIYAPVALFNIAAIFDRQGDVPSTIATLRDLVARYPTARESVEGHLYIAALQSDKAQWADALATLDAALARPSLTYADRIEAHARRGYVLIELARYADAEPALAAAISEWRRSPRIDDPYYIAMAHYYRGELAHRKFAEAPVRLPDDQLVADLEARRVLAVQAYDLWKESLGFKHAYWATAAGYQMSQIFVELWEVTVKAPYPTRLAPAERSRYVAEVHDRVREHLEKALEGHRMNVELAKAYGVETTWSKGSEQRAVQVMELLAKDATGARVTP